MTDLGPAPGEPLPPLKEAVEAVQIEHEGQPMVLLRDQEGITREPVALSPSGFLVAIMLDGRNTAEQVRDAFSKNTGAMVTVDEIRALVDQLDRAGYLETPLLRARREHIWDDFRRNPLRPATHKKTGYPGDALELAATIGEFFRNPKGPQKELPSQPVLPQPVRGLIAPHIDLGRGGPAYAWSYRALAEGPVPDAVVALGVAHMSPNSPWAFTKKSYETPYGALPVNEELYRELGLGLWYEPAADEWCHRTEHSLEFQALWLKYIWRERTPAWVPILCSTFERFCPDRAPSTVPTVEEALGRMGEALRRRVEAGQRILILAGVDFAHVGPRFGDKETLGPELEARVEKEDRASLDHALRLDADGFYLSVIKDGHWRKVCGLSATYTALRLMKIAFGAAAPAGELLTYGQAPDPLGGLVSFAGARFI
jgi:AmmeMemoRadiSam system protein B